MRAMDWAISASYAFANMKHRIQGLLALGITIGAVQFSAPMARAFSLMGPFDGYQTAELNYNRDPLVLPLRNPRGNDLGGPQNLGEEYRKNVGTIYYAYDYAFLDYFGARGMEEVDKAVKVLNDLPAFSSMSESLSEYPPDTQRINYRASALGLVDLKSFALV